MNYKSSVLLILCDDFTSDILMIESVERDKEKKNQFQWTYPKISLCCKWFFLFCNCFVIDQYSWVTSHFVFFFLNKFKCVTLSNNNILKIKYIAGHSMSIGTLSKHVYCLMLNCGWHLLLTNTNRSKVFKWLRLINWNTR